MAEERGGGEVGGVVIFAGGCVAGGWRWMRGDDSRGF